MEAAELMNFFGEDKLGGPSRFLIAFFETSSLPGFEERSTEMKLWLAGRLVNIRGLRVKPKST